MIPEHSSHKFALVTRGFGIKIEVFKTCFYFTLNYSFVMTKKAKPRQKQLELRVVEVEWSIHILQFLESTWNVAPSHDNITSQVSKSLRSMYEILGSLALSKKH